MRSRVVGIAAAAVALWGCASAPHKPLARAEVPEYRIGTEDVVEVAVYQSENLSRTVPVRPDGKVTLPLLGDVQVQGKTARELSQELQTRYTKFVGNPHVTVIVKEINAPRVYVLGEVGHPGSFPLRGRMDVVQGLAIAGGFGPFADKGGIVLIHKSGDTEKRDKLDYDEMIDNGEIPELSPGDTIYVP